MVGSSLLHATALYDVVVAQASASYRKLGIASRRELEGALASAPG